MNKIRQAGEVLVVAAAIVLTAGCGQPTEQDGSTASPAGEAVRAPDGAYVEIPEGALPAGTHVEIRVVPTAGPALRPFSRAGRFYELLPHGVAFAEPVTVHIPLNRTVATDNAGLYTMEEGGSAWTRLDAQVDADDRMIVARVDHFSFFTPGGVQCATTCGGGVSRVVTSCLDTSNAGDPCDPSALTPGSIREVLCDAQDCDAVTFALPASCGGAISISGPPLQSANGLGGVDAEITIDGGPSRTTIDGSGLALIPNFNGAGFPGAPAVLTLHADNATLRNLVLTGAPTPPSPEGPGAGLEADGSCELIEGNVLSGNGGAGLHGAPISKSWIRGNYIGVLADLSVAPNGQEGIRIEEGSDNRIGGPAPGDGNYIDQNGGPGVDIHAADAVGNLITRNDITGNLEGGITLDPGNEQIVAPSITARGPAVVGGTTTAPDGSIIELFGDPGLQGETYLCSVTASSGAFAAVAGASACPAQFPSAGNITATVTDPGNDTSDFSGLECVPPLPTCGGVYSPVVSYVAATLPDQDPVAPWSFGDFGQPYGDLSSESVASGVLTLTGGDTYTGKLLDRRGVGYLRDEPSAATAASFDYTATLAIPTVNGAFTGMDGVEATSYVALFASDTSRAIFFVLGSLDGQRVLSVQNSVINLAFDPDDHPSLGDPGVFPLDWTQVHTYTVHFARCDSVSIAVDGVTLYTVPYASLPTFGVPFTFGFVSGSCVSEWTSVGYEMCQPGAPPVQTCATIQRGTSGDVADAVIAEDTQAPALADTNNGSGDLLWAGDTTATANQETLLRFDLGALPAGATVTSAAVTLRSPENAPGQALGPGYVRVHLALAPWSEGSVTWNSFGGAFDPAVLAEFSGVNMPTSLLLPNAVVEGWIASPATNDGLLFEQTVPQSIAFRSSEHPAVNDRPSLTVCYTQ